MGGKWAEWAEESNTHKLMEWRKREREREREERRLNWKMREIQRFSQNPRMLVIEEMRECPGSENGVFFFLQRWVVRGRERGREGEGEMMMMMMMMMMMNDGCFV